MKNYSHKIVIILLLITTQSCQEKNSLFLEDFYPTNHEGYVEFEGKIYHKWVHGGNWTKEYSLVEGADAATFSTIEHDLKIDLGKDKNNVYADAYLIDNSDPKSFVQVKDYFWKDKNNVYLLQYGFENVILPGADPSTFEVFENYDWSRDAKHVYFKFDTVNIKNPIEFIAIDKDWGKDKNYYYHNQDRIDSLDYSTAEIVSGYYIKDKYHVFFGNVIVEGANPKTFEAEGMGSFGHDDKNMFDWGKNDGPITEEYRKIYMEND